MKQLVLILVFALGLTKTLVSSSTDNDRELAVKYARVFGYTFWRMEPERTLEYLKRLDELLADKRDKESMDKRKRIQELIGHSNKIGHNCDFEAAEELSNSLSHHKIVDDQFRTSIMKYLKSLRDKTIELCRADITKSMNDAALRITDGSVSGGRVLRLKELVAEQFHHNPSRYLYPSKQLYPMLLALMGEQAGAPLGPESLPNRQQFNEQFQLVVTDTCKTIRDEFGLFLNLNRVLTREKIKQMDKTVVDWFNVWYICFKITNVPEVNERIRDNVYVVARSG